MDDDRSYAEVAEVILAEVVENEAFGWEPNKGLDVTIRAELRGRTRLYKLALVLLVLSAEERKHPRLAGVRQCLEDFVFGLRSPAGEALLTEIRSAMRDLGRLLEPTGRPIWLSWARAWLS